MYKSKLFNLIVTIASFLDLQYHLFFNRDKCFDLILNVNWVRYNMVLNMGSEHEVRILKVVHRAAGSHCIVKMLDLNKEYSIPYTGKFKFE